MKKVGKILHFRREMQLNCIENRTKVKNFLHIFLHISDITEVAKYEELFAIIKMNIIIATEEIASTVGRVKELLLNAIL